MTVTDWKREAKHLQDTIDRMRDDQRREQDAAFQRREDERKERRAEFARRECEADSWEEAFDKGIARMKREARDEQAMAADPRFKPSELDFFFVQQVEQYEFARTAWKEETAKVEERVNRIRERAVRMIQ